MCWFAFNLIQIKGKPLWPSPCKSVKTASTGSNDGGPMHHVGAVDDDQPRTIAARAGRLPGPPQKNKARRHSRQANQQKPGLPELGQPKRGH